MHTTAPPDEVVSDAVLMFGNIAGRARGERHDGTDAARELREQYGYELERNNEALGPRESDTSGLPEVELFRRLIRQIENGMAPECDKVLAARQRLANAGWNVRYADALRRIGGES